MMPADHSSPLPASGTWETVQIVTPINHLGPSQAVSVTIAEATPRTTVRWAWVDHLRTAIILLVVNMHACVTYSHVGGWYVKEGPEPGFGVQLPFILWQGHLQAFFMGLLFFLAGVFAYGSVTRRGPGRFLRERFVRLGVPALLYMLFVHPFMVYVLLKHYYELDDQPFTTLYGRYLTSTRVLAGNGPMWFALALLAFCAGLAAWRAVRPSLTAAGEAPDQPAPGVAKLLVFGAGLALATAAARLVFPMGTDVLNFQLGNFPQYIAAFVAGIAAGRGGWAANLARSRRARLAGWMGLIGGPILFFAVFALGGVQKAEGFNPYMGGRHWQALGYAMWEQFAGLGLALGIMAWFQRRFQREGPLARWLAARSFGVYVLHPPVLVALTLLLRTVKADPFTHMALLTALGIVASFAVADAAKRVPGLRGIL